MDDSLLFLSTFASTKSEAYPKCYSSDFNPSAKWMELTVHTEPSSLKQFLQHVTAYADICSAEAFCKVRE